MSELEHHILSALVELEALVKNRAATLPQPSLLPVFARLEDLAHQLPPDADPNLRHYLHKKSYEKARLLLQGRDAQNARGTCR